MMTMAGRREPYVLKWLKLVASDRTHRYLVHCRAAHSVDSGSSLRRFSSCGIAHSGDLDLRFWDYRDPAQGQTTALGGGSVYRGLLYCTRMVAQLKAVNRWRLASRR